MFYSLLITVALVLVVSTSAWCRFPIGGGYHSNSVRPRHSTDWSALEMALSRPFLSSSELFRIFDEDNFFNPRMVTMSSHHPTTSIHRPSHYGFSLMPMDVIETTSGYEMIIDLPGVDKNAIDISIKGDEMTISAERSTTIPVPAAAEQVQSSASTQVDGTPVVEDSAAKEKAVSAEKQDYVRRERQTGSITRSFTLPDDVDTSNVKAESKDGVLRIMIGKKPDKVPEERKISIF